jgi:hypothetical protein
MTRGDHSGADFNRMAPGYGFRPARPRRKKAGRKPAVRMSATTRDPSFDA